jgi:NAD(P)H dehydrogenase (quinone)
MNVLIVHAHHEPKSFSSTLSRQAEETLRSIGHEVTVSDLYAEGFDPVSDRRNFQSVFDANYLKQQNEERHASDVNGFAPSLEREIARLEACDLLIFSFPLWWFGMPAILKGWVDRAFPMKRVYGGAKLYENGLGQSQKRAMVMFTAGGGADAYSGHGVNPSLETVVAPIEHGVFWFNGFLPLAPFVVWTAARLSPEERAAELRRLDERLRNVDGEKPRVLAPLGDFPGFGLDRKKRFMVAITRRMRPDENFRALLPGEVARIAELKRLGAILNTYFPPPDADPWRGFVVFRESGEEQVRQHLATLPLAPYLDFQITEVG